MIVKIFNKSKDFNFFFITNPEVDKIEHIFVNEREVCLDDKQSLIELIDMINTCKVDMKEFIGSINNLFNVFLYLDIDEDYVDQVSDIVISKLRLMIDNLDKQNTIKDTPNVKDYSFIDRLVNEYFENNISYNVIMGSNNIKELLADYSKWILDKQI